MGLLLFLLFFAVFFTIIGIWGNAQEKKRNRERELRRQKRMQEEETEIEEKYPDGYTYYKYKEDFGYNRYNYIHHYRSAEEIVNLRSEIIKKQAKVDEVRKKNVEEDNQFIKRQNQFVNDAIDIAQKHIPNFGRYCYTVPWMKRTLTGGKTTSSLTVWQFFPDALCLDQNLDYSLRRSEKNNFDNLHEFKDKKWSWLDSVYKNINNFLAELANHYPLGVFFNKYIKDWEEDAILYHYKKISRNISNIQYLSIDRIGKVSDFITVGVPSEIKYLVVIDCYTENNDLKNICSNIFEHSNPTCIIYLSLLKCYDKEEMVDIIEKEKKKERRNRAVSLCNQYPLTTHNLLGGKDISDITDDDVELLLSRSESDYQKQEQEMKKKEEDRNKAISLCKKYPLAALYYLRNFKGLKEIPDMTDENVAFLLSIPESAYQEQEKKSRAKEEEKLLGSVSSWDTMLGGLKYSYLFYYYPTTCEFEATEDEWENRWLVWDFKNTPNKTSASDHQKALNRIIPMLKEKLVSTFGEDRLKRLTLVCIPASSRAKNKARYEEFSNRICGELGMTNAYPHITVVSEKESKHTGGTGLNIGNLSFDEEFFRDKYVLLFDDVITKGNSMKLFKRKMELLGAKVVGGMSLGKTKHER